MTDFLPRRRGGLAALLLAAAAGASAPLASTVPALIASVRGPEVHRTVLDCPRSTGRAPSERQAAWLARCGLVRR